MIKTNGIHHVAIMAADMRAHIDFFSDVLGARLVALFDMHGVPDGIHAFLHLSDDCYFSLVTLPRLIRLRQNSASLTPARGLAKVPPVQCSTLLFG